MVTSFTSPSCTLLTNSVSVIALSFLPGPALTNTNSIAANRSRTTQNSNVFRFELTKPPQPAVTYLTDTYLIDAIRLASDSRIRNTVALPELAARFAAGPNSRDHTMNSPSVRTGQCRRSHIGI